VSLVNILLTHPEGDNFEPFVHGATTFQFSQLNSARPLQILDGAVWIFVDWVLDDMAGIELCRRLRADAATAGAHITMVLDDNDPSSRKRALDAGADDYINGPVDRRIVLDRVLALNPEFNGQYMPDALQFGPLTINLSSYRAYWKDTPIEVSPNEFRLLRFLADNANRSLTRAEIVAGLGKDDEEIDERTVDVWIGRLRKAIKEAGGGNPLRTVRLIGYVFDL
jgi:two-component system, OmpR family, phosphate regulon response regulator PhoB